MRNKHRDSTGRSRKKGYKLKLSKGQAHLRSIKGWQTRHAHGWHTAAKVAANHGRLSTFEDPYERAHRATQEHGYEDLGPDELQRRLEKEGLLQDQIGTPLTIQDAATTRAVLAAEQRALAEHMEGRDISARSYERMSASARAEMQRVMQNEIAPSLHIRMQHATPAERAAYLAGVLRQRKAIRRQRYLARMRDRIGGHTTEGEYTKGDTTDIPYFMEDDKQREVTSALLPLRTEETHRLAPETEASIRRKVRAEVNRTLRPVNPNIDLAIEVAHARLTPAERAALHAVQHGNIKEDSGERHVQMREARSAQEKLRQTFEKNRYAHLADDETRNQIIENVVKTRIAQQKLAAGGMSAEERSRTLNEYRTALAQSERDITRSAAKAGETWEHLRDAREIGGMTSDEATAFFKKGFYDRKREPDPFPHDLRTQYTVEDLYGSRDLVYGKGIKGQARFLREQTRRRAKGVREGNTFLGVDERGITAVNQRNQYKVPYAVLPNKHYSVIRQDADSFDPDTKQRTAPYHQYLEMYDTGTKFKEGQRDKEGRLIEGEVDELVTMVPVRKYSDTVNYHEGQKKLKGRPLPKAEGVVDEIRYLPVVGANGTHTKTIDHPTKTKRVYRVREPGRRQYEEIDQQTGKTRNVYSPGVNNKWRMVDKSEYDKYDRNNRSIVRMPAKVQYVFADPALLEMGEGAVDTLDVKLPRVSYGDKHVDERVIRINLNQGTRREAIVGPYLRERKAVENMRKTAQAEDINAANERLAGHFEALGLTSAAGPDQRGGTYHETVERHLHKSRGFKTAEEGKIWASAAAAAGYETSKKMSRERAKLVGNRAWARLGSVPPFNRVPNWHDELLSLNRAYLRPLEEKKANMWFSMKHPFASPSGVTGGVDWGRPYYRTHMIDDSKIGVRRLQRAEKDVARVVRTRQTMRAPTPRGLGRFGKWRQEALSRHPDYKDFPSFMDKRIELAQTFGSAKIGDKITFEDPFSGDLIKDLPVTAQTKGTGANLISRLTNIADHEEGIDAFIREHPTDHININTHGLVVPHISGKTALVGGGIAASAIGAHYLYHRHQQSKLAPQDRTAYYNRILPPAVTVPTVHARVTGKVALPNNVFTREFGMDKMKMPVRFGVSAGTKKIGLRPKDRDYPANLPLGIAGFRPHTGGTRGGKRLQSLAFYPDPLRRTFTRGTHNVSFRGHKVPGTLEITGFKPTRLSRTNPNRMTNKDREEIIWATKGTGMEAQLKQFYSSGDRVDPIVEMFGDHELYERILKRKGPRFGEKGRDKLLPPSQRAYRSSLIDSASESTTSDPRWAGERGGFNYTPGEIRAAVAQGVRTDLTDRFADTVRGTRHAPGAGGPFEASDVKRNKPGRR